MTRLEQITSSDDMRLEIAQRCIAAGVDGMRADIIWHRAAVAHAAWQDKTALDIDDLNAVEDLVINHRRNDDSGNGRHNQPPPSAGHDAAGQAEAQPAPSSGSGAWG